MTELDEVIGSLKYMSEQDSNGSAALKAAVWYLEASELKQKLIDHQAKQITELAEALRAVQQTIGYCSGKDFANADVIILPQLHCCYETITEVLKIAPHHRKHI